MTLHLTVELSSRIDQLVYDAAGKLSAKMRASAQDGKANAYLIKFWGGKFGVAKSSVTIVARFDNSRKRVEVDVAEGDFARFRERILG